MWTTLYDWEYCALSRLILFVAPNHSCSVNNSLQGLFKAPVCIWLDLWCFWPKHVKGKKDINPFKTEDIVNTTDLLQKWTDRVYAGCCRSTWKVDWIIGCSANIRNDSRRSPLTSGCQWLHLWDRWRESGDTSPTFSFATAAIRACWAASMTKPLLPIPVWWEFALIICACVESNELGCVLRGDIWDVRPGKTRRIRCRMSAG